MVRYIALLRGINVGGNKKVPMADFSDALQKMGFKNVKTVLASGNALFDSPTGDAKTLAEKIGLALEKRFGFPIPTIVVSSSDLDDIVHCDPFKGIAVTPQIRLYVTFFSLASLKPPKLPYVSSDGSFRILRATDAAVFSVLDVLKTGTVGAMAVLEKMYGKNVTTRNWNTVLKIASG